MTVTKENNLLPYLTVKLLGIMLLIFPLFTGILTAAIESVFDNSSTSYYKNAKIVWGGTLFYGTWSFLLFILLPYSLVYIYSSLSRRNIFLKFLAFFVLLTLMGFVVPEGSVIDFFGSSPYPRVLILYFFLTITLCPLCNIALDRIVKNRSIGEQE
ncbi:hypothetical protein [Pontibacter sp. SGAir0037]|uniref:hypothetical protein n=1 Tax=Pontibacter sp. SGAir0037 TaxID=2571030 RepID=UPI0010CCE156|nr:hypothetical protein [Pontibacter sp. SGAir0037]QCR23251.1 hypothetical protein C1N53_13480 [Pontibacter sp. SGAir0037]